jgi:hypothetical protein
VTRHGFFAFSPPEVLFFPLFPPPHPFLFFLYHSEMGIANFPFPSFTLILTSTVWSFLGLRMSSDSLRSSLHTETSVRLLYLNVPWSYLGANHSKPKQTNTDANADPVEENHSLMNLNSENNLVGPFPIHFIHIFLF